MNDNDIDSDNKPLIGKQISWKSIKGKPLKIIQCLRLGQIDDEEKIHPPAAGSPYALLTTQDATGLTQMLPVMHRDDFRELCTLYDTQYISETEQVQVIFMPKSGLLGFFWMNLPHLTYRVAPV